MTLQQQINDWAAGKHFAWHVWAAEATAVENNRIVRLWGDGLRWEFVRGFHGQLEALQFVQAIEKEFGDSYETVVQPKA